MRVTLNDVLEKKRASFRGGKKQLNEDDLRAYSKYLKEKEIYGVTQEYLLRDFEEFNKGRESPPIVVDLGTYNRRFYPKSINVDLFQEGDTDLVWDITTQLPIRSESVDYIVCSAVLEHVNDPVTVVNEMFRVLKIGGRAWVDIPFMQPYHESPDDFQRYTLSGIKHLFRRFYLLKIGPIPGNGFILQWLLDEFRKILEFEKIDTKKYPSVDAIMSKEYLKKLGIEVDQLDKELVKKYPSGIPEVYHRTASGIFVYAEKR